MLRLNQDYRPKSGLNPNAVQTTMIDGIPGEQGIDTVVFYCQEKSSI